VLAEKILYLAPMFSNRTTSFFILHSSFLLAGLLLRPAR
jgi:hypothetical protein